MPPKQNSEEEKIEEIIKPAFSCMKRNNISNSEIIGSLGRTGDRIEKALSQLKLIKETTIKEYVCRIQDDNVGFIKYMENLGYKLISNDYTKMSFEKIIKQKDELE